MTEREFGYAAVQDGRFVERLRSGKGTLKVIEKVEAFLGEQSRGDQVASGDRVAVTGDLKAGSTSTLISSEAVNSFAVQLLVLGMDVA